MYLEHFSLNLHGSFCNLAAFEGNAVHNWISMINTPRVCLKMKADVARFICKTDHVKGLNSE